MLLTHTNDHGPISGTQGVTLSDICAERRKLHTGRSVLEIPEAKEWELLKLRLPILCLQASCVLSEAFR